MWTSDSCCWDIIIIKQINTHAYQHDVVSMTTFWSTWVAPAFAKSNGETQTETSNSMMLVNVCISSMVHIHPS